MYINLSFFIYFFIASWVIVSDLIIGILELPYLNSLIFSLPIILITLYLLIHFKKIRINSLFSKKDLFFLIPFVCIIIISFINADTLFDTSNYHLYLQSNFFSDKVNFDFFNNSLFFFPLADRMSYIIRFFTTYRLGTFLSAFSGITIFYLSKKILKTFNINDNRLIIYSASASFLLLVNYRLGTYHIDNIGVIFLLELLYIVLNFDIFDNNDYLIYQFFLAGIITGIKLSNVVWYILIFLLEFIMLVFKYKKFFIKNLRKIKIKTILISILLFVLPWIIYAINNYIQVRNPIYPFANQIFNSPYFKNDHSKLVGYGPNSFLEGLLWPFEILFNPKLTNADECIDLTFTTAFILSIIFLFKKDKNKTWFLSLFIFVGTYTWVAFMYGYSRYAMFLSIIAEYLIILTLEHIIKIETSKLIKYLLSGIIISILFCNFLISISYKSIYWSNDFVYAKYFYDNYEVIKSRKYYKPNDKIHIDGVWTSIYNTAIINLIREDTTPIYNLYISRDIDNVTSNIPIDIQYEVRSNLIGKNVYTICPVNTFEKVKIKLAELNVDIIDYYKYINYYYQNPGQEWYILKLNVKEQNIEDYLEYMENTYSSNEIY